MNNHQNLGYCQTNKRSWRIIWLSPMEGLLSLLTGRIFPSVFPFPIDFLFSQGAGSGGLGVPKLVFSLPVLVVFPSPKGLGFGVLHSRWSLLNAARKGKQQQQHRHPQPQTQPAATTTRRTKRRARSFEKRIGEALLLSCFGILWWRLHISNAHGRQSIETPSC